MGARVELRGADRCGTLNKRGLDYIEMRKCKLTAPLLYFGEENVHVIYQSIFNIQPNKNRISKMRFMKKNNGKNCTIFLHTFWGFFLLVWFFLILFFFTDAVQFSFELESFVRCPIGELANWQRVNRTKVWILLHSSPREK